MLLKLLQCHDIVRLDKSERIEAYETYFCGEATDGEHRKLTTYGLQ